MKNNIALLTVTDTRTIETDKSGRILVQKIKEQNHKLFDRKKEGKYFYFWRFTDYSKLT